MAEEYENATKVEKSEKVFIVVFIPCHQAAEAVKPGEQSLDFPSTATTAKGAPILRRYSAATPVWCNQLDSSFIPQPFVEFVRVIGFVPDESIGDFVDEAFVERCFNNSDFMGRSAFNPHRERKTVAVRSCHDLGPFAALRLTNSKAPLFAPVKEPSMKPSSKSSSPSSKRC